MFGYTVIKKSELKRIKRNAEFWVDRVTEELVEKTALEIKLSKFDRKRGKNGKFIKQTEKK